MRYLPSLLTFLILATRLAADDTGATDKHRAVQEAMALARQHLDLSMPAEAVAVLEAAITHADGNKAFLMLLREAYLAELYRLERAEPADPNRAAQLRRSMALLAAAIPSGPMADMLTSVDGSSSKPTAPARPGELAAAVAAFKRGDYAEAARLFAAAPTLSPEQKAAWAYCRLKLAARRFTTADGDPATAQALLQEITESLELAPQQAELQRIGQALISAVRERAGTTGGTAVATNPAGTVETLETNNFLVQYSGDVESARSVADTAEKQRKAIFGRWSGPPASDWKPKCRIVIHPSAASYARLTGRPAVGTGHATVRLTNRSATERRIDLRADDPGLTTNSLPRELTHVILADLFPDKPPPRWAEVGMAVLAGTPEEVSRYTRTLPRCAREGEWLGLDKLLELTDFPHDKITAFYCQSVSLTEYLVRLGGGERNFTLFLRDCQRYGTTQALRRQYGIDGAAALEQAWTRTALGVSRGQSP
jgi:tetratricopeptide (TPR) repeat protein